MDRYLSTLIIWLLLLSAPAFGAIQHKTSGSFVEIAAVQHKAVGTFTDATPMAYIGSAWYTLLNYSDNYEYHFFVGAGQSNAQGYGDGETSPTGTGGIEIKTNGNFIR